LLKYKRIYRQTKRSSEFRQKRNEKLEIVQPERVASASGRKGGVGGIPPALQILGEICSNFFECTPPPRQTRLEAKYMSFSNLPEHLVQSEIWGKFKTAVGTPSFTAGGVRFTLHKLPLIPYYIAYAPKADLSKVNFDEVAKKAKGLKAVVVRFDVPNHLYRGYYPDGVVPHMNLARAPKDTFAKYNVLLDLFPSEEELFKNFKEKTRYNVRLAQKHGVIVNESSDISIFLKLNRETAKRQGFYIHPDIYYKTMFDVLSKAGLAKFLVASLDKEPLASWILISYKGVLYYPYGGSSDKHREVMASNLLMWEAIKLGKNLGCKIFDMWGATNDEKDPWWGFTRFKLGYGGELVKYEDSLDLVIRPSIYKIFNVSYKIFWFFLRLKTKIFNFQ